MSEKQQNLLIIGTLPSSAGVGGVTVHVERILQYLDKQKYPYTLFDYKKESFHTVIRRIWQSKAVHIHVCNPYYMFLITLVCSLFNKKYFLTLHGKYTPEIQHPWAIIKYAIKHALVPIVLNKDSYEVCWKINSNTSLIPAFIPPQIKEVLEPEIIKLVEEIHKRGNMAVVTYGFDDNIDINGNEIYGINFLVSFFSEHPKYELIVVNPTGNYEKKYRKGVEHVHIIGHPLPLYELFKIVDMFVRNTSKDGDSLSVKEALYLRRRVLCTDVVDRPRGVQLFKYSDSDSLNNCLDTTISINDGEVMSGEKAIIQLYRNLQ